MSLTFDVLRAANRSRIPEYKNAKGETYHLPDGADWSPNDWATATMGELGEAANILKKVRRGDMTMDEARPKLAKEFADVVTYLDILALNCGVDLGRATIDKFNEVSARVGAETHIQEDGSTAFKEPLSAHAKFHQAKIARREQGNPLSGQEAHDLLHKLMPSGGAMCNDCWAIYQH